MKSDKMEERIFRKKSVDLFKVVGLGWNPVNRIFIQLEFKHFNFLDLNLRYALSHKGLVVVKLKKWSIHVILYYEVKPNSLNHVERS